MENANRTPKNVHTEEAILSTIEVRFNADGSYSACSHNWWMLNEMDSENLRQVRIFKRGAHRIKLAIYNRTVINLDEFGAWLCAKLIDRDETVWRHVDLRDCDR